MIIELYSIQVGWGDNTSTFEIEIECPKTLNGCTSESMIKREYNTKIKGHPQHYECPDCKRHFFPQTSGFFAKLENSINEQLFSLLKDGKIDNNSLYEILGSCLSNDENACWVCETPFDVSKPANLRAKKEDVKL